MVCATMRTGSECNITHRISTTKKVFGFLIVERKDIERRAQRCATYPNVILHSRYYIIKKTFGFLIIERKEGNLFCSSFGFSFHTLLFFFHPGII